MNPEIRALNASLDAVETAMAKPTPKIHDAALIAEAFTVASETGLSPRQLLEQRDAMSAALWGIRDNSTDAIASKVADDCLAAITKGPEKQ